MYRLIESKDVAEKTKEVYYNKAKKIVIKEDGVSATLLQKQLGIGYSKAATLIDFLE